MKSVAVFASLSGAILIAIGWLFLGKEKEVGQPIQQDVHPSARETKISSPFPSSTDSPLAMPPEAGLSDHPKQIEPPKVARMISVKPVNMRTVIVADNRISHDLYVNPSTTPAVRRQLVSIGRVIVISEELTGEFDRKLDGYVFFRTIDKSMKNRSWVVSEAFASIEE